MHYTGGRWISVITQIHAWITAIKMLSPTDGWAIGNRVYHYDGVSWRRSKLAGGYPVQCYLRRLAQRYLDRGRWFLRLSARWQHDHFGLRWQNMDAAGTLRLPDYFSITALSMVSSNQGWAVGSATLDGSKGYYPPTGAILHYVNGTWRIARTLPSMNLQTVSMGSASDGWVGGNMVTYSKTGELPQTQSPGESDTPKLWHYISGQWVEVSTPRSTLLPAGAPSEGQISSITMFSATEGWMLGNVDYGVQSLDQSISLGPDVFYLKQGRWVQVQTPTIQQRRFASIGQVVSLSPNEFWVLGVHFGR